jgi:hypothetical protein
MYFLLLYVLDNAELAYSIFEFPCILSVAQVKFRVYTDTRFDFTKLVETVDRLHGEYRKGKGQEGHNVSVCLHDDDDDDDDEKKEKRCGICMNPCQTGCEWKCSQCYNVVFDESCIMKWFQINRKCPICRKEYSFATLLDLKIKVFSSQKCVVFDQIFTIKAIEDGDGITMQNPIDLT